MSIWIHPEETKDFEQVREVVRSAFPTDAEGRLVDALRANGKAVISLVAVYPDRAVHPDVQLQGIGSRLINKGLNHCRQQGYDYCVVLGDPNYYQRFGFENATKLGLQNEYSVDHEFMVIRFSNAEPAPGLVKYESEFGRFSV